MCDQALLNPYILRPILRMLRWYHLDECRLVCQTWRDEVDVLRNFRPPVMITSVHRGCTKFDGVLREQPLISIVFEFISNEDFAWLGRQSQTLVIFPYSLRQYSTIKAVTILAQPRLCGFTIPSIKGVQVCVYQFDKLSPSKGEDYVRRWVTINRIIKDNIVKCALLFSNLQGYSLHHSTICHFDILNDITSYISRNQPEEPEIAIGGGVFMRVDGGKERKYNKKFTIVLFYVPKSDGIVSHFQAFSNIFQGKRSRDKLEARDQSSQLENELKLMSERVSLLKHSIAFMFSGENRPAEENELFSKYFPNTPIVKSNSLAECGTVSYSVSDEPSKKRKKTDLGCTIRENTTSLVILTWK